MTCTATFYRAQCEQPSGHTGAHTADAGAGTQTVWTDNANDPPQPTYQDTDTTVYHGDCLNILPTLPDNSVDAVITDPPYGLEFMGKEWDQFKPSDAKIRIRTRDIEGRAVTSSAPDAYRAGTPYQTWCTAWAIECLRILKPGGHLLAFGGTRTWHRLAAAIEDAGFEIRDSIAWLYGSGFPKSLDVSKAIDKAAGAQREVVGYQRLTGNALIPTKDKGATYAVNAGVAPPGDVPLTAPATDAAKQWQGWGTALKPAYEPIVVARKPLQGTVAANVQVYGTGALNIDACRINPGSLIPGGGGFKGGAGTRHEGWNRPSHADGYAIETHAAGRWPPNVALDQHAATELDKQTGTTKDGTAVMRNHKTDNGGYGGKIGCVNYDQGYGGEGGGSRFFPTFKYQPKAPGTERPTADGVAHPTVKPVELIQWLIKLVTPPGGTILDPFAGTGTTGEAAIKEHKHAILIEREHTYLPLIIARLNQPMAIGFNFD